MKLQHLNLAHYRGFEQLDIDFEPDVTLIAGVNGVGKSSVLDAIATVLSRAIPEFTPSRSTALYFTDDDIHEDRPSLEVSMRLNLGNQILDTGVQRVREGNGESDRFILLHQETTQAETRDFTEALRSRTLTGDIEAGMGETRTVLQNLKKSPNPPLAVYFTPERQLLGQPRSLPVPKPFDVSQAYGRALHDREVELREFMHWFRTQEILGAESEPRRTKVLEALRRVVSRLVPEFTNLRIQEDPRLGFVVEKQGQPLYLHQLSDGERGLLALVFDLTRRLAMANPDSDDPIAEGKALVMIDEIEQHLHPKWQRHVVRHLREIFKNCQFVFTTHSPQVIGQVKAEHLRLIYIDENGKISLTHSSQSFGMDSSWILQNIMGVPARDYETEQKLAAVYDAVDSSSYKQARVQAESLRNEIGDFPELQEVLGLLDRLEMLGQNEKD